MKKIAKKLVALTLAAATLTVSAGAVTPDGQSETWFDGVWSLIDSFGLKAEDNPYILQNYINKYLQDHPEEMYNVINDILSLLDTHSMYLSSEEYSEGFATLEGFVGIGVGIQQGSGGVLVSEVMRYSAAEEAGLQIGDLIIAVDGKDTTQMTHPEVAELLRGKEGTSVAVTVRRQGRELTITCVRRQVNQVYVSSQTMADGVEYIKVSAMGSQNDWEAFSETWEGLDEKNTRAVILDLRGNGGGVIDIALQMADAMTQDANVYLAGVHWREDMGGLQEHYSTGGGLPLNKIVVLVDGGTASAAELLAGSLQDNGVATLVGETTYGKGQGQYHLELLNGDKLVITTLELELPKQGCWEGVGLTPDVMLENRTVTVNAARLTPLDTTEPLRFGMQSDNVYAMTERLVLLGLLDEATNTFDGKVTGAVQSFLASYDMEPGLYASAEMLQALDEAMQTLDGQTYELDEQLLTALELCKLAAAEPQQYTALPDGSWKKN
ncbi:S41 family peptidase [Candidatus Agathobaculum pullicola]|uniref:S41 family peptidase n=1 Tax=Candidatus Agathobaculum pullicola TaxID=2838426 RepID=UPI003F938E09